MMSFNCLSQGDKDCDEKLKNYPRIKHENQYANLWNLFCVQGSWVVILSVWSVYIHKNKISTKIGKNIYTGKDMWADDPPQRKDINITQHTYTSRDTKEPTCLQRKCTPFPCKQTFI